MRIGGTMEEKGLLKNLSPTALLLPQPEPVLGIESNIGPP